jgi:hypothetical protein
MAVDDAGGAVEFYFQAFNKKDSELVTQALHYPHIRIDPEGRISVLMNEFDAKKSHDWIFNELIERDEWDYSTLDYIEVVHKSPVKVHFKILFGRYRSDDTKISVNNSLWIVTLRDGEWKILARSSYAS